MLQLILKKAVDHFRTWFLVKVNKFSLRSREIYKANLHSAPKQKHTCKIIVSLLMLGNYDNIMTNIEHENLLKFIIF